MRPRARSRAATTRSRTSQLPSSGFPSKRSDGFTGLEPYAEVEAVDQRARDPRPIPVDLLRSARAPAVEQPVEPARSAPRCLFAISRFPPGKRQSKPFRPSSTPRRPPATSPPGTGPLRPGGWSADGTQPWRSTRLSRGCLQLRFPDVAVRLEAASPTLRYAQIRATPGGGAARFRRPRRSSGSWRRSRSSDSVGVRRPGRGRPLRLERRARCMRRRRTGSDGCFAS
jgi:hypothetical protein